MNLRFSSLKVAAFVAAISLNLSGAQAETVRTIYADFGTRPAGPNTDFSVNLTMAPADTDIAGFSCNIYYDNTQVSLINATDNCGQSGTEPVYNIGPEFLDSSTPHVNAYKILIMSTAHNLHNPTNLGQLQFKTTAAYDDPDNRFWLHLTDNNGEGLVNGNLTAIPTAFHGSDGDPQLVPVSLSDFALE